MDFEGEIPKHVTVSKIKIPINYMTQSDSACKIMCKQYKGNHRSTDPKCADIANQRKTRLKLYFDAKAIASSAGTQKTMSPTDDVRAKLQEMKYKNEMLINQARKMSGKIVDLEQVIKQKDEQLALVTEEAQNEGQEFVRKINEMNERFEESQKEFKNCQRGQVP